MQSANKVIVLEDGEDVMKLNNLYNNSLQEILRYQGASSAFNSDDY
jgi:hypothetical protein